MTHDAPYIVYVYHLRNLFKVLAAEAEDTCNRTLMKYEEEGPTTRSDLIVDLFSAWHFFRFSILQKS